MTKVKDLSCGIDIEGKNAVFLEKKHLKRYGLSKSAKRIFASTGYIFFRIIDSGEQTDSYGYVNDGEVVKLRLFVRYKSGVTIL